MSTPNENGVGRGDFSSSNPAERKSFSTAANMAGLAIVALIFVALAALSWRKWPDAMVDFGTQLYIPWRILGGAVLYRDLFYFAGGPFSQYFNALLFKIFGASFSTLIAANLCFAGVMVYYVYRRFLAVADGLTATIICVGIVSAFIFSEYVLIGNYNFIAPYSHETVHGVIISIFVVGLLSDWLRQPRWWQVVVSGFCAGLVFLTKPDIFVALMACCTAALGMQALARRQFRILAKSVAVFGLVALLPPLIFIQIFLRVEDWHESLRSVVFGWLPMFKPAVTKNIYYVIITGRDHPVAYLEVMASNFFYAVLVIVFYAALFRALGRKQPGRVSPWILWLVAVAPLVVWASKYSWMYCGTSLPLWCLSVLALLAWQLKKSRDPERYKFPFLWSVFALMLMAKLGFFARIYHYGFALAMPAFAATVYFVMWLLPGWLETQYQVPAKFLRATFLVTLLVAFAVLVNSSQTWYQVKHQPIGHGGDKIYAFGPGNEQGEGVKIALDWMETNAPPESTMAVIPNGVTLNFLSRRVNPTPCIFWDPNVMAMFGQDTMTAAFEAAPPDYILLVEESELGVGYFGTAPGYGVELMRWIKQNYKAMVVIGNEPLRDGRFGIEILKRLPAVPGKP